LLGLSTGLERESENGVRAIRKSLEKSHFNVVGFGKGALANAFTVPQTPCQLVDRPLRQI